MHDPKFETEVQQKMDELEFSPSEGVWVNLQRKLHKEKRRRVPLLWLFFLLGGILLGVGGTSLYFSHNGTSRVFGPAPDAMRAKGSASGMNATIGAKAAEVNRAPAITGAAAGTKVACVARNPNRMITITFAGNTSGMTISDRQDHTAVNDRETEGQAGGLVQAEPAGPGVVAVTAPLARFQSGRIGNPAAGLDRIRLSLAKRSDRDLRSPANIPAVRNARLSREPAWQAGFTGGGGISSVYMPRPPNLNASLQPFTGYALNQPLTQGYRTGQLQGYVPKARPDLSFWAGIFVEKPVFKKLSLTAGLNLHYYSTRLETGQKEAGPSTPTISLFSVSPYLRPAARTYPYYAPGNSYEYTNRYYFLEIPVSLQWQFNHSRRMPLFWEGGLSLSRLISSNALYFNEKSGVYFKDGQVANPTHLMAFTSVMIGLSWRGNLIQLGPQGQYGLTSLLNANSAGYQHLFYGGIKITIIPRKL